ncbi:MAG: CBS domain-containing protein, partial [Pseudomonadota bacterium]
MSPRHRKFPKTVSVLLNHKVVCIKADTRLSCAVEQMDKAGVSSVVVTDDERPIGIFTERELVAVIAEHSDFEALRICEKMSCPVITAPKTLDIREACHVLLEHRVRRLVVVDEHGAIAGIVTESDMIERLDLEDFVRYKGVDDVMSRHVITCRA